MGMELMDWLQMAAEKRHAFLQVQGQIPKDRSKVKTLKPQVAVAWQSLGLPKARLALALSYPVRQGPPQVGTRWQRSPEKTLMTITQGCRPLAPCLWGRSTWKPQEALSTWLGWDRELCRGQGSKTEPGQ